MRRVVLGAIWSVTVAVLATLLVGCKTAGPTTAQDKIREYLYRYQPTTGEQFAAWAAQDLTDYAPRQVYDAILAEGRFQAELGHPNGVGVLSFAAQAWATRNDYQYDAVQWITLQQEATENLRSAPGTLRLWPTAKP